MASPTAIPHPETSAHHHRGSISHSSDSSSPPSLSASSPRGSATNVFASRSPIYTQAHAAGRAFSLSTAGLSVSPTTPWSASSGSSIKDRAAANLTSPVLSRAQAQKDYFPETSAAARRHSRAASTGGANAVAISTADLSPSSDGPTTPRFDGPSTMTGGGTAASVPGGGMALGRVPSLPLGSSFDQLKAQRTNWGAAGGGGGGGGAGGAGWGGLGSLRGTGRLPDDGTNTSAVSNASASAGARVGGLFRKFSLSSGSANPVSTSPPTAAPPTHRSHSLSVGAADSVPNPAPVPSPPVVTTSSAVPSSPPRGALPTQTRGRRPSGSQSGALGTGQGSSVKRRPSPMGERLLMGHFSHH